MVHPHSRLFRSPTIATILDFSKKREFSLKDEVSMEKHNTSHQHQKKSYNAHKPSHTVMKVKHSITSNCPVCSLQGTPVKVPKLPSLDSGQKQKIVTEHNYCYNCLGHSYHTKDCQYTYTCCKCTSRHHTLLHHDNNPHSQPPN